MAGATYSVNIELNHKAVSQQVDKINQDVKRIGKEGVLSSKKKNKIDKEGEKIGKHLITDEKQRLLLASKRQKVNTRIVRLEDKGKYMSNLRIKNQKDYYSLAQLTEAQTNKEWAKGKVIVDRLGLEVRKVEDKLARQNSLNVARQKELNIAIKLRKLGDSAGSIGTRITNLNRGKKVGPGGGTYGLPSSSMLNADARGIQNLNKVGSLEARKLRRMKRMLELEKEMTAENRKRNNMAKTNFVGPGGVNYGKSKRPGLGAIKDYRRGQVWQSAAISGAFPLLFGQGPVTAAAGALGGGLGAKFGGQMGGFAGGLAATAAISTIGNAVNAVKELGQAMGPFTQDTSALITATGQANTFREKELNLIAELKGKQEAFNEAMKDMTKLVGQKGVEALKQFGEDTKRLSDDWARFMTQMSAGLARLINWSGILKQGRKATVNKARGADYADDEEMQRLLGRVDVLSGKRRTGSVNAELLKIEKDIKERILYLDEQNVIAQDKKLAKMEAQAERLKSLDSLYKDIGGTIKDGLVQGIQAAIDGTKSLGEIAGNVFRKISNALLDFGVSMALANLPIPGAKKFFGNYANGGRPPKGRPSIVGERGPELFVPDSAGTIIPNHEMGGTNVVVNVDASGSAVQGDGGQAEELGSMLAAAVQAEIANQQRPGGLLAGTR